MRRSLRQVGADEGNRLFAGEVRIVVQVPVSGRRVFICVGDFFLAVGSDELEKIESALGIEVYEGLIDEAREQLRYFFGGELHLAQCTFRMVYTFGFEH